MHFHFSRNNQHANCYNLAYFKFEIRQAMLQLHRSDQQCASYIRDSTVDVITCVHALFAMPLENLPVFTLKSRLETLTIIVILLDIWYVSNQTVICFQTKNEAFTMFDTHIQRMSTIVEPFPKFRFIESASFTTLRFFLFSIHLCIMPLMSLQSFAKRSQIKSTAFVLETNSFLPEGKKSIVSSHIAHKFHNYND